MAGTDRDNNNLLGEEGELFGIWPSLDMPLVLDLAAAQNVVGLDFALDEMIVISPLGRNLQPVIRRRS